jgi:DNA-binding response OmpR family regulator
MNSTVLIADDEIDFVELLAYTLEEAGFTPVTAVTGKDALLQAQFCKPAVIILDVHLAEMDGFLIWEMIRKQPETAHIPVIFLTGCTRDRSRNTAEEMGAAFFLTKPISPKEVIGKVRQVLSGELVLRS